MDAVRRDDLIQRMQRAEASGHGYLLVALEDFFAGNDQYGSICPNLDPPPDPAEVFSYFAALRNDPDVGAVYVMPSQIDAVDEWPFADTIWVMTRLSAEELSRRLPAAIAPSEIFEGWPSHYAVEQRPVPAGMRPFAVWYD